MRREPDRNRMIFGRKKPRSCIYIMQGLFCFVLVTIVTWVIIVNV